MLVIVVLIALGGITVHTGTSAPTPTPHATPTPTPTVDPFTAPRWMVANGAVISWIAFLGLLPFLVVAGVALHARYRGRLIELDHPPLRDREAHRRVRRLEPLVGKVPDDQVAAEPRDSDSCC